MDIIVASEATMLSNIPTAGNVTLFINTDKNNVLYYISSDGVFHKYSDGDVSSLEECCSCEIAKKIMDSVACALRDGLITPEQLTAFVETGINVTTTEQTNAETGVKTCSVDVGPRQIGVLSLEINEPAPTLAADETYQLTLTFNPSNASNKGVVWVSSNPTVATVDQNGLVTGLTAGTATVYAYSTSNSNANDSLLITVSGAPL